MKRTTYTIALLLLVSAFSAFAHEHHKEGEAKHWQEENGLVKEWTFWPNYTLSGSANNYPGPRQPSPENPRPLIGSLPTPLQLLGNDATESVSSLLTGKEIPAKAFTIEMWLVNHVNQPIGVMAAAVSGEKDRQAEWALGYYDGTVFYGNATDPKKIDIVLDGKGRNDPKFYAGKNGFKKYWHHLVGSYDGKTFRLYHNGQKVAESKHRGKSAKIHSDTRLELSAYLNNESYMDLGNAIQYMAVYNQALDKDAIGHAFKQHSELLADGRIFDGLFHYTAGPFLNLGMENSINVVWETDRPATAVIEWGDRLPYEHKRVIKDTSRLHSTTIDGLDANTPYFYRVTSSTEGGKTIDSGALTFRTMPGAGEPLTFAVVGDTEARPHVNDRIAKQVWGERPNFVMLVGDLTDGGQKNHRWQWTHEYFQSMTQLGSRIPFTPAPGNGESDLFWYNYYHDLPGEENFYSYRVGDVEFFMLDSNMGHRDRDDPKFRLRQRRWLESALKRSNAKWKIAGHHHPVYSADENDYGDSYREPSHLGDKKVRGDFLDLYEKYGVDVVFFGHLHSYERTWPIKDGKVDRNGVTYVQTGGGGGNHEETGPNRAWFTNRLYSGYHYTLVKVFGDTLEITAVDSEGRQRDGFTMTR